MASTRVVAARVVRCGSWREVLGAVAGASLLFWLAGLGLGVGDGFLFLVLAVVVCGGAAAFVLDDPAAAVGDASPTGRTRQAGWRALQLLPLFVGGSAATAAVARGDGWPDARGLGAVLLGVVTVGVTVAAVLRRAGRDAPGEAAAVLVVVGTLVVVLADPTRRWVHLLPSIPGAPIGRTVSAWCALTVVCAATAAWAMRDPGARRRSVRRRAHR